jgi:nucleotide-binding universal stress UspA family protein
MFDQLLVPLDGSRLAEAALPVAAALAQSLHARVTLLHVVERRAPHEIHGERHLTEPEEAAAYLREVARRNFPPPIVVDTHVHTVEVSDVARAIVAHMDELAPDLVVMCTHGHGGLRDWVTGSIAQQAIGAGDRPILLLHPGGDPLPVSFRRFLVALDGDPDHEQGLAVAGELARALDATLHLVMVVHTPGTLPGEQAAARLLLPGATRAMLDLAEEGAQDYLETRAQAWRDQGRPVTTEVCRGDPPAEIVRAAEAGSADLIVLGTHGKAGTRAFWTGSAGPKIVAQAHIPVLLVPV